MFRTLLRPKLKSSKCFCKNIHFTRCFLDTGAEAGAVCFVLASWAANMESGSSPSKVSGLAWIMLRGSAANKPFDDLDGVLDFFQVLSIFWNRLFNMKNLAICLNRLPWILYYSGTLLIWKATDHKNLDVFKLITNRWAWELVPKRLAGSKTHRPKGRYPWQAWKWEPPPQVATNCHHHTE